MASLWPLQDQDLSIFECVPELEINFTKKAYILESTTKCFRSRICVYKQECIAETFDLICQSVRL